MSRHDTTGLKRLFGDGITDHSIRDASGFTRWGV
jgi:hypothetical protein